MPEMRHLTYLIYLILAIALIGCSTTRGTISNFDKRGNPCDATITSVKAPWDEKAVQFSGVCDSAAGGSSAANAQVSALLLEQAKQMTLAAQKIMGQ